MLTLLAMKFLFFALLGVKELTNSIYYLPGFARVFAIICGCLQQWFKQTKGTEEALLEYQLTLTGILDELVQWNKTHDSLLLINSPLDDTASMSVLSVNLSLIRILEMAILHCPDKMNNKHWDFVLCSLAGWLQVILFRTTPRSLQAGFV